MGKNWQDINPGKGVIRITGETNRTIEGIASDSRKVLPGYCFVAQKGTHTDGHLYIPVAIEKGASVIVCETWPDQVSDQILVVQVSNAEEFLGLLASAWFNFPSGKLKVVGVTGTNGKTSIATLLYHLFTGLGYQTGLISTISTIVGQAVEPATHTTPEALRIQALLSEMVAAGCDYCFMEVSSHAVVQHRITGIRFAGGIFTNLTHDHLDYHGTFQEYLRAKKGFFDGLSASSFALVNADDKNGEVMVQNCMARKQSFSTRAMADFRCRVMESHFDGMLLDMDGREVWTHFVGKFNASNLLAVYGSAVLLNQDREEVIRLVSDLRPVRGRFEAIRSRDGKMAVVDYAHTPDALKNVLQAISEIRTGTEKVITVIGAGGDRDKTKRPEMAREAVDGSDMVILTSDNPRSEDPGDIIRDMEAGVADVPRNRVISITNRREAIKTACMLASPGDIILIAGKGHEDYQEIKGIKYHFDDREVVIEILGIQQPQEEKR